jgi:hypothetical protein
MLDAPTLDTDTFHEPLCHNFLTGHVKELVLEGRAAAVQNEDFHAITSLDLSNPGHVWFLRGEWI